MIRFEHFYTSTRTLVLALNTFSESRNSITTDTLLRGDDRDDVVRVDRVWSRPWSA